MADLLANFEKSDSLADLFNEGLQDLNDARKQEVFDSILKERQNMVQDLEPEKLEIAIDNVNKIGQFTMAFSSEIFGLSLIK